MAEIYVYRSVNSTGARDLARALNGRRVKEVPVLRRGDFVVCWGSRVGHLPAGVRALNNVPLQNKYEDALQLRRAGVPTIEVALQRPQNRVQPARVEQPAPQRVGGNVRNLHQRALELANEFVENEAPNFELPVYRRGVEEIHDALGNLRNALGNRVQAPAPRVVAPQPPVVNAEWIGRTFNHVGGKDLLNPTPRPNYFVKKEDIVDEYRIHSFNGQSIRAGRKVHRDDFRGRIHPWVRSWDGGWRMAYEGVRGTPQLRDLAHQAVRALGLDFGAVDIGILRDGRAIVLEVNRAPGIEGGTVERYRDAVNRAIGRA